jgi:hypothetical protein
MINNLLIFSVWMGCHSIARPLVSEGTHPGATGCDALTRAYESRKIISTYRGSSYIFPFPYVLKYFTGLSFVGLDQIGLYVMVTLLHRVQSIDR